MILSGEEIKARKIITPHCGRTILDGMSFGQSMAGYDIRLKERTYLNPNVPSQRFALGSSLEHFTVPSNVIGMVKDKSTWARRGLCVLNGILEPEWEGHLTLELACVGKDVLLIPKGSPIAQVIFYETMPTHGYSGKYQHQVGAPVSAKYDDSDQELGEWAIG